MRTTLLARRLTPGRPAGPATPAMVHASSAPSGSSPEKASPDPLPAKPGGAGAFAAAAAVANAGGSGSLSSPPPALLAAATAAGQAHLFDGWAGLDEAGRAELVADVEV